MPNLDLSNAADFAKLTVGGAAGLLSLFTGRGSTAWDIQEGAYYHNPNSRVLFHVFQSAVDYNAAVDQITDSGGRRNAKFLFPYKDGQLTEDLGKTPESFDINILLFGNRYMAAFNLLMQELNDPEPGILEHPIRGFITCKMESYTILHSSETRKAMAIRLNMVEHSFNGFLSYGTPPTTAPSALQKLADAFKKIDNAITRVEATLLAVRTVKNFIKQLLGEYKNRFASTGNNMNRTFNPGGQIPALLPVQDGGIQGANGEVIDTGITAAVSPNDTLASLPIEFTDTALGQALATEQIFKDIETNRSQLTAIIAQLESLAGGQGALEFYDVILDLRETAIDMQDAFEKCKQSSQIKLIDYVVPRVMTVREIAFANGVAVDDASQILLLNEEFQSANYFSKGDRVRLAVT